MHSLLLALALGAGALSNFPRDAGGPVAHAAVAAGGVVIVAAGEQVTAFRPDGEPPAGMPFALGTDEAPAGPPAAADVDGDGRTEVAVLTRSGKLFLWSGAVLPGFPVALGAGAKAGPSFADVDGDGKPEVLAPDERGRLHAFRRTGAAAKGYPHALGKAALTSSAASSSLGGVRVLAVGAEDGRVHVVDLAGKARPGFPLQTGFAVTGPPAFADLDDDGVMDLVVASQDFKVYAVDARGAALRGFPVAAGYRLYDGPAIADLDGDGRLDVAFAAADGVLHAVDAGGRPLAGFPVRVGGRLFGGPAVGDVDRDGALDVVAVGSDGTVAAFSGKGKPLAGFPEAIGGQEVTAGPLLFDLGGDGTPAIFVGLPGGDVHAVRAQRPGSAPAAAPWPVSGRDAARTGRSGPNAPSFRALAVTPAAPKVTDALAASWRYVWLDGPQGDVPSPRGEATPRPPGSPAPRPEWTRDGKPVPELEGRAQVPAGAARKGEAWRFALAGPGGARVESPELRIANSPPGLPEVALDPPAPTRADTVRLVVRKPAQDADGDAVTYRITWAQDGLESGSGDTYPGDRLRKGALLTARVVPDDGEAHGPAAVAQARVGDTPPGPTAVALEPARPARTDAIHARITQPATDPDGDPIAYQYRWTVGGEVRNLPAGTAALPAGAARKHDVVRVEVRGFDGQLQGPAAHAEVKVANSPPTAPRLAIRPERPRRGEPLRAVLAAPSEDADRDLVAYRFTWRKNGAPHPVPGDAREVPGAEVARGDRFEVTVVPNDGEVDGPAATATASVANTPPRPPRIALDPPRPVGGQPVKVVVTEPGSDADGQAVALGIAWTREGRPTGGGAETLDAAQFRKGERVRVIVTPRDGEDAGEPVALEVVVENAPPTAPAIAFTAERPRVTEALQVKVTASAKDPDGDPLRYRYRWTRDGAPVAVDDGTEAAKAPPHWTAANEVPARELAKGQRWEVEAQALDGTTHGPSARAAVVIANSPPAAPEIAFAPFAPRRGDGLALALKQPADADGDVITWRHAWFRNGERQPFPPDQAQVARNLARRGERWAVEVVASDGEAESPPVRREVTVEDTPPGPAGVALCDGPVPAGTVPKARITSAASDPDGDAVGYRYEWFVNGKPVPAASGKDQLLAPKLVKHDAVRVVLTPHDGALAGPPATAECFVVNTPPTAPAIAFEPAAPTAPLGVRVVVKKPAGDRDGDEVTYRHAWARDGLAVEVDGARVPSAAMRHGELWRVVVTPFDGEEEGESAALAAEVANTPPPAPAVSILPPEPATGQTLTCEALAPEKDADQEPIAIRYRWYRNDRAEPLAEGSAQLPGLAVRRGERWRCEAWGHDGAADGPKATSTVTVKNSPPPAPAVAIEPEKPRRGDDLACRVSTSSADPDGDPVTYTYTWTRNGKPVLGGADPTRIDAAQLVRGERWRCSVVASDGVLAGAPGTADAVVENAAPGPARVRLDPAEPRAGEPIRCEISGRSEDPDGDAVRYRFAWTRNGARQPFSETSQEVPSRLVRPGDRWRCVVTPTDGDLDGPPAGSEEAPVRGGAGDGASAGR
jgi:hypothetical protein